MKRRSLLGLLLGLALSALALPAAAVVSPPGSPDYMIGADDILQINVRPRGDLSTQVTVLSDGTINLPSVGSVKAAGLNLNKLSSELTRRYGLYDRDITQVTVTILAYNSQKVFLLGEVFKPGHYSFPIIPGLWDVVREAGGPTDAADLTSVEVIRGEGEKRETIHVDLGAAIKSGDFSTMPVLKPGDSIRLLRKQAVVPTKDQIYVMGDVRTPGVVSSEAATDVMSAIMAAGGPAQGGDLKSVYLTRRTGETTRTYELDMEHYLKGGNVNANFALRPGDAINVESSGSSFLKGMAGINTVLPVIQAIISSVIAIESIRIAKGTTP